MLTRGLKLRAKADDQDMMCFTNYNNIKAACLNTAVVDNAFFLVIEQEEILAYESRALQKEMLSCKRK